MPCPISQPRLKRKEGKRGESVNLSFINLLSEVVTVRHCVPIMWKYDIMEHEALSEYVFYPCFIMLDYHITVLYPGLN